MRITRRFHGLKRPKIRQTWNKYNLYNLSRMRLPQSSGRTHFQQKWTAKSETRAYHGEQIKEKQWERMFTSRIRSVVPMDYRYLAAHDGSEQAEGRGSGKDIDPNAYIKKAMPLVPYMQMAYAPSERRLDTAIFRALFASSTRQARQFVTHGGVKVNGKTMVYPGYLLNPGDMFQVEPERVLTATGASKDAGERRATRKVRRKTIRARPAKDESEVSEDPEAEEPQEVEIKAVDVITPEETEKSERKAYKVGLKELLAQAKGLLEVKKNKEAPSAKKKQELRAFAASVKAAIAQANQKDVSQLDGDLSSLIAQLSISAGTPAGKIASGSSTKHKYSASTPKSRPAKDASEVSEEDKLALQEALVEAQENPIDATKPYATPWRPRPYMSPFAFIPRYLEVNQNICAAVYLRHPVARPGLAEVPTPFPMETSQLAFTWYLRRR